MLKWVFKVFLLQNSLAVYVRPQETNQSASFSGGKLYAVLLILNKNNFIFYGRKFPPPPRIFPHTCSLHFEISLNLLKG